MKQNWEELKEKFYEKFNITSEESINIDDIWTWLSEQLEDSVPKKPLAEITDEDAIEVSKMAIQHGDVDFSQYNPHIFEINSESKKVKVGGIICSIYFNGNVFLHNEENDIFVPCYNIIQIVHFLSKNYEI